jgi:hypothetical protein
MFELMSTPSFFRSGSVRAAMICRRAVIHAATDCRRRGEIGTCYRRIRANTALLTLIGKKSNVGEAINRIPLARTKQLLCQPPIAVLKIF